MKCLIALALALFNFAPAHAQFNEAIDDQGEFRASFVEYAKSTQRPPYPVDPREATRLLGMPMGDAIKILPIPSVLSVDEYGLIQRGAQLRARTLLAFFADVIFNNSAKVTASGLLTHAQIHAIAQNESVSYNIEFLRKVWVGRSEKDLSMIYGPDIVRNTEGRFRVIEDNVGQIGGVGDIAATHNAFFSLQGTAGELNPPLLQAIEVFLKDIPRNDWSKRAVILYRGGTKLEGVKPVDDEDNRLDDLAKKLGIEIITPSSLQPESEQLKRFIAGEFTKVINIASVFDLPTFTSIQKVLDAFTARKLDFMNGPGMDILGNKGLLPVMDKLTELYLVQPPLLETQTSEWVLSSADLKDLNSGWVIKKSDGNQGNQVFILDDLTSQGRDNLRRHIDDWAISETIKNNHAPAVFIKQKLIDVSYLPAEATKTWINFNVDFRPHTFVIAGEPLKPAIWGRASPKIPGVLNNVSQSAMELIVTTPSHCERSLMLPKITGPKL